MRLRLNLQKEDTLPLSRYLHSLRITVFSAEPPCSTGTTGEPSVVQSKLIPQDSGWKKDVGLSASNLEDEQDACIFTLLTLLAYVHTGRVFAWLIYGRDGISFRNNGLKRKQDKGFIEGGKKPSYL